MAINLNDYLSVAEIADATSGNAPKIDCSVHIQAAANAASVLGDMLIVNAGRYLCSNITLNNVALVGAGTIDLGYDAGTPGVGAMAHSGTSFWCTDTSHSVFIAESGSTLRSLTIFYPEQTGVAFTTNGNKPTIYPPAITIPTNNENILIENVGCPNAYQFLQIGSMSNTNAVGRITLRGLRVYSIYCDIFVDVLRDVLNLDDCSFTFGWWDQTEVGTINANGVASNLATWTALYGRSFIIETADGVAANNCFWFCKGAAIQSIAGSETTSNVGLSQFNRFNNCLFDGCSSPIQSVFGGSWTSTTFTNCIFTSLDPGTFQGTYPWAGVGFDANTNGGTMRFIGCEFVGALGNVIRLVNHMDSLSFVGCNFRAWSRYSGSSQAAAIYLGSANSRVIVDSCTFDPSGGSAVSPIAIECEACASLSVSNSVMENTQTAIYFGSSATTRAIINGVSAYNTSGSQSIFVASGSAAVVTKGANDLDKAAA